MENVDFSSTLVKLRDQVRQFTTTTTKTNIIENDNSYMSKFNIKSPFVYYGSIPITILIILLLSKPNFIKEEVIIEGSLPETKMSIKRLLLATIIITTICAVIIVYYHRSKI